MTTDASKKWRTAAEEAIKNGRKLLEYSDFSGHDEAKGLSFALAVIAQEEFAKAFLYCLIADGALAPHRLILRTTKDHVSKQLLGLVMEYLSPDVEEFLQRVEQHSSDEYRDEAFAFEIADPLNIFRHVRIERWRSGFPNMDESEFQDIAARHVAKGSADEEKQDGLYVRVGRDGSIASTPASITPDEAMRARNRAQRLASFADSVLEKNTEHLIGFDRVVAALTAICADVVDVA
jgi:hypothetical protein